MSTDDVTRSPTADARDASDQHRARARDRTRGARPIRMDAEAVFQLFLEAAEVEPAARDAFLEGRCGKDPALESEVRCLLAFHDPPEHTDDHASVEGTGTLQFETFDFAQWSPSQALDAQASPGERGPRYLPLGVLGRGGFGQVDRWFDRILRRWVAAKRPLKASRSADAQLLHEARLLAYLDHPGVVAVHDLETVDGQVVCVMRRLEGQTLDERLAELEKRGERLPISETLRLLTRVIETMANAHAKGVVHLDLKPGNIVLQRFGQVAVIDWGIARFFDVERYQAHLGDLGEGVDPDEPDTTRAAGTPTYMPPEQFVAGELGPTADIYALGTMMFEMLTGRVPFEPGRTLLGLAVRKRQGPPRIRPLRPDVSETLEAICLRMIAPNPADRPASLDAVLDELAALTDFMTDSRLKILEAGEKLIAQGAVGHEAYQVIEGELAVVMDQSRVIRTQGPGDIVGELSLISEKPRSADVIATRRTVVRVLDWAALTEELKKVNPVIGQLLRGLSDRLIEWR